MRYRLKDRGLQKKLDALTEGVSGAICFSKALDIAIDAYTLFDPYDGEMIVKFGDCLEDSEMRFSVIVDTCEIEEIEVSE